MSTDTEGARLAMVIAALICFGALVVAWIMAPDEARTTDRATTALEPELAAIG